MFKRLLQQLPIVFTSKDVVQLSRQLTNKVFQNMRHDDQNLLPGFYYYIGLQIKIEFFSTYSAGSAFM
jgi:hypothetical protein